MRIVEINILANGSTGKIMFQIAKCARANGAEVRTFSPALIGKKPKKQDLIPGHTYYGSWVESNVHYFLSRYTGYRDCFGRFPTRRLLKAIKKFQPDLLHLHNIHSAYLYLPALFSYIKKENIKTIWTLHDCWSFTGQCPHFTIVKCDKWKTGCQNCLQYNKVYPATKIDCTKTMWKLKKKWFTGVNDMTIVTPSQWLADLVKESYLKDYTIRVINNGIDLSIFKPTGSNFRVKHNIVEAKKILLGVAFDWSERKGLDVFIELAKRLNPEQYQIVLVGTNEKVDTQLPQNIIRINKTQNQVELAEIYTAADLFVNPTREENYPTVNMEALACGTPVLTFRTGGSPEILDETCGCVVDCDDVDALEREILRICKEKPYTKEACLKKAENFDMNERFKEYIKLYEDCTHST